MFLTREMTGLAARIMLSMAKNKVIQVIISFTIHKVLNLSQYFRLVWLRTVRNVKYMLNWTSSVKMEKIDANGMICISIQIKVNRRSCQICSFALFSSNNLSVPPLQPLYFLLRFSQLEQLNVPPVYLSPERIPSLTSPENLF